MAGELPIFAEDESGRLVPMSPAAPPSEDELQELIAEHPDVVGETEGELLFLSREQPVADSEGGTGRWSLDHLFVTRGAVPVLLEVKRATDTRLRREGRGAASRLCREWDGLVACRDAGRSVPGDLR